VRSHPITTGGKHLSPKPRPTFAKRQKEQARQEKQRAKMQRKLERKLENQAPTDGTESEQSSSDQVSSDQVSSAQEPPVKEGAPVVEFDGNPRI
jgi:hypothetical protein